MRSHAEVIATLKQRVADFEKAIARFEAERAQLQKIHDSASREARDQTEQGLRVNAQTLTVLRQGRQDAVDEIALGTEGLKKARSGPGQLIER